MASQTACFVANVLETAMLSKHRCVRGCVSQEAGPGCSWSRGQLGGAAGGAGISRRRPVETEPEWMTSWRR